MALRLKPETREAWRRRIEAGMDTTWRPVPRSEPVPEPTKPDTDMFINGYVD